MSVKKSSPTYGSFAFDVPEPKDLSGEFVYNYFTSNERSSELVYSDEKTWLLQGGKIEHLQTPWLSGKPARKIKLYFTPLEELTALTEVEGDSRAKAWADLRDNKDSIVSEVNVQCQRTAFLALQDDGLASELQATIDAEIIRQEAADRGLSPLEAVLKYNSITSDNISASDILDTTEIEASLNLTYYDPATGEDITAKKQGGISEYAIGGFFNRKFIYDAIKGSENLPFSPLWGTVSDLLVEASSIQETAVYSLDSNMASMERF